MFCARAAGHDGGQCDPAHYCAAERSADAIVDCHRSWSPRSANLRLCQHTDALLQPCHTCDDYDDGCSRFPVCRQIVVSLISRHNARFVHDLLRNLGSCRRTVATFTRTRRGFLSFLVRSRAEEDGCHSCFGVPGCLKPRSDVFTIHSWPTSAQLRRCVTVVLHGSWIPDNCGCYLPVSPRCATGVLHGSRVSCGGERRPPPARAT